MQKRSSLVDLREAGAEHQLLKAQAHAREALEETKQTSSILRNKIAEVGSRSVVGGRSFTGDRTTPPLPRGISLKALSGIASLIRLEVETVNACGRQLRRNPHTNAQLKVDQRET
jgi:hypothetical protein